MTRLILLALALLTGCAHVPDRRIQGMTWDSESGCYSWEDGSPVMTAAGERWCVK
jgi:hypothetical protein